MRLLNANTYIIGEHDADIPPYAILSHTWGNEEVSFVEMLAENKPTNKEGYRKLLRCCKQAVSDGLEFVWIDTCCIDKRSSAELSEAINSMFSWYQRATLCYAYLEDVKSDVTVRSLDWTTTHTYPASFHTSRWFTRGWTLQELIAPPHLVFYSSDWTEIGTRDQLQDVIAGITKISRDFFRGQKLESLSIAQKTSWASHRITTRQEDQAYCLLGIFGVNMPLLYGEGNKAFIRLQEEIMRRSDDQSIFAWKGHNKSGGLLAPSPALFSRSGFVVRCDSDDRGSPYHITNKGIQLSLPVLSPSLGYQLPFVPFGEERYTGGSGITLSLSPTGIIAVLNCRLLGDPRSRMAILVDKERNNEPYSRKNISGSLVSVPLDDIKESAVWEELFFLADSGFGQDVYWPPIPTDKLVIIQSFPECLSHFTLEKTIPETKYRTQTTGVISIIPPEFVDKYRVVFADRKILACIFRRQDGAAFILALEWPYSREGIKGSIMDDLWRGFDDEYILGQAKAAIDEQSVIAPTASISTHSKPSTPSTDINYKVSCPGETLLLSLKVKEVTHASFIKVAVISSS